MSDRKSILDSLDINRDDWVLEIGSGPIPFERSDIIADKFLGENTHRSGDLVVDRPLVICDAHCLPFADKSFDYVFCSQILEHLENPKLFFDEIARVGKKGYIETPNEIRERLFGWPFHRWIIEKDENGLIIRKNDVRQDFGLFFHKLQLENYEFARFCATSHDLLNIRYQWHGMPVYRFAAENHFTSSNEKASIPAEDIPKYQLSEPHAVDLRITDVLLRSFKKHLPRSIKKYLKSYISTNTYGKRHSNEQTKSYLVSILACPICKRKVSFERHQIICLSCKKHFKIDNDITYMLDM